MNLTRSQAFEKPPSIALNSSYPLGGSPLKARIFLIPHFFASIKAYFNESTVMLVHVRCIITSRPVKLYMWWHISNVKSEVEPPAPHVTSTHNGFNVAILSILSKRFSIPASVFGGKYSKE